MHMACMAGDAMGVIVRGAIGGAVLRMRASRNDRRVVASTVALLTVLVLGGSPTSAATGRAGPVGQPRAGGAPAGVGGGWHAGLWQATASPLRVTEVATVIGATSAAAAGLNGAGVGVALIDTGVAPVPGLPGAQIVNGPDLSFESQGAGVRYLDTYGHGTHLAGIIVGDDASVGLKGIAPKAKLTSVKVGSAQGAVDVSQMLAAIDWVVKHRNDDPANPIRVITLAYGTSGAQSSTVDPLAFAVENAWRAGIVVVVAGGNAGNSAASLTNPGYDPYVLSVGSAAGRGTATQADDSVSTFTSVGSGRTIDLVAPGESIVSLRNPNSYADVTYPQALVGTRLFKGSGSSQAAAVTAGAVALLLQQRPTLKPDQVKALLKNTATATTGTVGTAKGIRQLNLATALPAATPAVTQTWAKSTGHGSIEQARGADHVTRDGTYPLVGDFDLFGAWNVFEWVQATTAGTAWNGGVWRGRRMAGDGWTGTSWASRTWAAATWSGGPWGAPTWQDSLWSGRYWSNGAWSGRYWSGRYWSTDMWTSAIWA
jgi:serine protease AprX